MGLSTTYTKAEVDYLLQNLGNESSSGLKADLVEGKVPSSQLPSYVDDILEFANLASFPATGESGKIYIALDTNKTYRWSGSTYIYITSGAVDSVAGKTGVVTLTKSDVGLSNVDNIADINKNVLSATKLTTARAFTIGTTAKSFDGTAAMTWSLAEIGAQPAGNYMTTAHAANSITLTDINNWNTAASLPIASATVLGGVKIGTGISIDGNGVISANAFTPGTANRLAKFSGSNLADSIIYDDGNVGIGTSTPGARLDVKAQGALSTDIAFRVRNSADTQDFLVVTGAGEVYNRGAKGDEFNTFFGEYSGINSTVGGNNGFGRSALTSNTTGHSNCAFGNNVLQENTTGYCNNSFGAQSLINNITGNSNNAFGYNALESNTEGNNNIAIGGFALGNNTTGDNNTAVGSNALQQNTTGNQNVALGTDAGRLLNDGNNSYNTIASNSIYLGYDTRAKANNETNQIVIGHSARGDGSNSVVLGNSSITRTRLQGQVIMGSFTTQPSGIEGAIYYNSTDKKHYGFNGTSWNALY